MKLNHCEDEVIADCYQLANVQEVLVRGISGHSIIASKGRVDTVGPYLTN